MSDKGRQLLQARITYLTKMYEAVPLGVWGRIMQGCVEEAETGDKRAIRFLGKYLLPGDLELIVESSDRRLNDGDE